MKTLTWDELLAKRDQLLSKDIEYESAGKIFRGPIETFLLTAEWGVFGFSWLAWRSGTEIQWTILDTKAKKRKNPRLALPLISSIRDPENGRIELLPPKNPYVARYFLLLSEENLIVGTP